MADRRSLRDAGRLARHAYTLQPTRSLSLRITMWAAACMLSAAAGAAGMLAWQVRRAGLPPDSCTAAPVSEDSARAELERGRLALAQESAARGAVQKTADSAAAEVARLSAELQFLRGQGKARPPAQTAAPRR